MKTNEAVTTIHPATQMKCKASRSIPTRPRIKCDEKRKCTIANIITETITASRHIITSGNEIKTDHQTQIAAKEATTSPQVKAQDGNANTRPHRTTKPPTEMQPANQHRKPCSNQEKAIKPKDENTITMPANQSDEPKDATHTQKRNGNNATGTEN